LRGSASYVIISNTDQPGLVNSISFLSVFSATRNICGKISSKKMVMKIEVIQIKASGFGKQYLNLRNKQGTLNGLQTNFKTFQ